MEAFAELREEQSKLLQLFYKDLIDEDLFAGLWPHATETERRTLLVDLVDLVEHVEVHEDRLTVALHEAPPLNVAFSEVGLEDSDSSRVGGGIRTPTPLRAPAPQADASTSSATPT